MSGNIIQLNEDLIKNNLKDLVRDSVEETLNALLDHEADELVRAGKYERTGDRKGYRSGHYERNFGTTSGEVKLRVPKLKGIQFETAIINATNAVNARSRKPLIPALHGPFLPERLHGDAKDYFPTEHWSRIRTNNLTERVNREIRRRTRAIGAFPDGNSALMLVCARLRHVAASEWGSKRYMDMEHLFKMEIEQPADAENPYI